MLVYENDGSQNNVYFNQSHTNYCDGHVMCEQANVGML